MSSPGTPPGIVIVVRDAARRRALTLRAEGLADGVAVRGTSASARDVDAAAAVGVMGLDADDPAAEARVLVQATGLTHLVFVGTEEERLRHAKRLLYEPLLPRSRRIVGLDGDAFEDAVSASVAAATGHARRRRLLSRMNAEQAERAEAPAPPFADALTRVVLDTLAPPERMRDAYGAVVRGALAGVDVEQAPADAARALRRVLRRVEVLGGPEAREKVAREIASVTRGVLPGTTARTVHVHAPQDADGLVAAFREAGGLSRVRAATLDTFAHAVRDLVKRDVTDSDGIDVELDVGVDRVTAAWSSLRGSRRVTTSVAENDADA